MDVLVPVARWLDHDEDSNPYTDALQQQQAKFRNMDLTPSARMIEEIKTTGSFFELAQKLSQEHHENFSRMSNSTALFDELDEKGTQSCIAQRQMEKDSVGDFDAFLADYLNQIKSASTV